MAGPQIDLINIDDALEALALRSVLEYWDLTVHLHHVGKASDLVALFANTSALSPYLVLMAHGVERGIALPELGEETARGEPYRDVLTPQDLAEILPSTDAVAISTACLSGRDTFAEVFHRRGFRAFVAPVDYPSGSASLMFVLTWAYQHVVLGRQLREAIEVARAVDGDTSMFRLFEFAGRD